jgi:biopolymer transport protein ExbD
MNGLHVSHGSGRSLRQVFAALVMLLAVQRWAAAGTLTNLTVQLTYADNGKLLLNGEKTDLDRLPKHLKSLGARETTTITITIPKQMTTETMVEIGRKLAAAGIRKFMFARPREPSATVNVAPPSR